MNKYGVIKIADFGFVRDVFKSAYVQINKKSDELPLPIRSMAPEYLIDGKYTAASDVVCILALCIDVVVMQYVGIYSSNRVGSESCCFIDIQLYINYTSRLKILDAFRSEIQY